MQQLPIAKNRNFSLLHLHSTSPLGMFPSEYCHAVWFGKTRMAWLPDGEKVFMTCLLVLTQSTNVTDRQTDGRIHTQTAITLSILNGFSNFFSLLEIPVNFQQNPCSTSHHTFSVLLHYFAKFRSSSFGISGRKCRRKRAIL